MDGNALILAGQIVAFISTILAIIKGADWIMKKIDKRIDERIEVSSVDEKIDKRMELNPALRDHNLTLYKLNQLQLDVATNKANIQIMLLKLAKLNGE